MRRPRLASTVVLALALVTGGLLYAHVHRFDGGPLRDPSWGGIGAAVQIGKPVAFTEILLENTGGGQITLEKVSTRGLRPGTSVRLWAVTAGKHAIGDVFPFPPPGLSLTDLHPINGYQIAGHGRDVELVAEITASRLGCIGFDGLTIDYTTGFIHYRRTARDVVFHGGTPGARGCQTVW
jgi:hypothetical protein